MRIAVVSSMVSRTGANGEDLVVLDQIDLLRSHGHEVLAILPASDELAGRPGRTLRAAVTVATGGGPDPSGVLAEFRPDVVHVHNTYPNLGRSWVARARYPVVLTLHSYRFACANASFYRDGQVCTDCVERPTSAVRHGCYDNPVASLPYAIAGFNRRRDPLLHGAHRIIALNPRMREYLAQIGVDRAKVVDGLNTVLRAEPSALGSAAVEPGRWLAAGRFVPAKGFLELVRAWPAGLPLDIIGEGPELPRVQAVCPPSVRLLGGRPREVVRAAMDRAVGLVVPSTYFEGLPLVYVEALAAGLPVVGFEPNRVAALVAQDGTGEVADWRARLAPVLARIADADPALRQHCRDVYQQRYAPSAFVAHLLDVYEQAIDTARSSVR